MTSPPDPFLAGGGEMGERMRALARSDSPLGPVEQWSQSLKTTVRIMLTSRQPIWVGWGRDLVYLYNDSYREIVGGRHPWALGRPTREVWAELWDVIEPMLAKALEGDEGTYVESQLLIMERHGYREETYYTFSYSPVPDDDGSVGGLICANTDDTQRVVHERQMALLKELAAAGADALDRAEACSLAGEALATNRRDLPFALIYAGAKDASELELLGTSGFEPGHPLAPRIVRTLDRRPWPVGEALATGSIVVVHDLASLTDGPLPTGAWDEPPTKAALVPIPSARAGPGAVLVVGLNPFRRLDAAYEDFLEVVAGEIANGIANAEAYDLERRRARALAELDQAKTVFFSNVSHEFRTPLTLMLGPIEDLIESGTRGDPAAWEQLAVVHRNGLRLLRLVNTLLDFSRIEAGRMRASFEPVDLAAATAELASNFRSACERAGLELVIDCPTLPEPVHVDRGLWEKIVLNLVSNAFKFTHEGQIVVRLEALEGRAVLSVRDTGVGIPPEELPRIFERFHRVSGSRGRTHEGSGIGLALVQELARLHGGTVDVESALDQGSRFRVSVPFGTAHLDPERIGSGGAARTTDSPAAAFVEEALRWLPGEGEAVDVASASAVEEVHEPDGSTRRARVLWADDNADMREYVARLLRQHFDVETVRDGEQALAAARARRPDLVLSDVMMPRLDGFGLVAALRADPELASVPILLLSARSGEEARIEGAAAGADDYLVKPFSERELLARVEAHLRIARLRREAESAVRESESRYRSIFTNSRAAIVISDAEGVWQDVNPAMCALIGRSREELVGSAHPELVDDGAQHVLRRARVLVEREGSWHGELPFLHPDGRRIELDWQVTKLGESDLRLSIATDVTAAKTAHEAVRESEDRYRMLVSVVTDVPWVCAPSGEFGTEQPEWAAYTGQTFEQYRGFGWADALHPDDREKVLAAWERAREERTLYRAEGRLWHAPSRAFRRFTVRAVPRLEPDQTIREWVGACTDVEQRMRMEDAMRESEQRFRTMANTAPAMLWITEPDGTRSFLSRGWYEFTGQTEQEGLGLGWLAAVHPDDRERVGRSFLEANEEREPFSVDYRLRSVDGTYRWAIDAGRPRIDAEGYFRGYIGSVVDVHELKRAEASLREKTERLEEEDRRKDLFLATLGHELRNPLAALASAMRAFEDDLIETAQFQAILTKNVDQLTVLVNDLLEVARITRGKIELKKTRTDLLEVLRSAVHSVRSSMSEKRQTLTESTTGSLLAEVDPARVEQVITNLLSNASKYTPERGRIDIALASEGDHVVLTVADTGHGIAPGQLESIFDPFVQQDPGAGGLGIGLSLVRSLVDLHGGSVHAESPGRGKGSRFTVHLPVGAIGSQGASRVAPPARRSDLAGRVLVVDDSRDNADMLALLLSTTGAETRCAYTGRGGLEAFDEWRPDVALIDIGLPDMTGYDVAREIRASEAGQGTLLLAVTGYGDDGAQRLADEAGFDARLVKPVDHDALQALLAERLSGSGS